MNLKEGQYWRKDGLLHREDGPAITYYDADKKYWYLNGQRIEEFCDNQI